MKAPEIINGKVVKRWFSRGKARIPIFEDGTIGLDTFTTKGYEDKNKIGRETREQYRRWQNASYQGHTKEYYETIEKNWESKMKEAKDTKEYNMARGQRDAWRENRLKTEKQEEDFNKLYDNSIEDKSASKMIDYNAKTRAERYRNYNTEVPEELRNRNTGMTKQEEIANRVKQNKIVDSFGNYVVYQDKAGNWINSRENYNNYVNGKSDRLGGELVFSEKEARQRLAELDADDKYPYQGYVADMKSGNSEKAKVLTKQNLDKIYKTIGYDDSKYNYGFDKDADIEFTNRIINEVKTSKIDRVSSKADMELKKETQRITQKPTVADVRKELRNMNSWSDEKQYGNIVVTKTGNTGYHIRNVDDVSDPQTDYFAGVYGVKEKQVLKTLEEKGFITNNKDVKAKVERFRERKGTTRINKTPTKRELAERIVDSQIQRGIVSKASREMLIKSKMNMSKEELEKYFK